jgi:ATP-dependent Clp protease ATP-binding subunit ClpA
VAMAHKACLLARAAAQVLLRRTKNNPVLVGEPGVGKTALVEGVAQLLVSGSAPPGCVLRRAMDCLDVLLGVSIAW